MRIGILNYKDAVPTCVRRPAHIWNGMARMYPVLTGMPLKMPIDVDFISSRSKPTGKYDLVIIPAMRFDKIETVMAREKVLIKWLRDQYAQGAELASICV